MQAWCGRIRCYVSGPLFLLAAVYVGLSAFGIVALHPDLFLLVVFGACCVALCAEIPLASIRKADLDLTAGAGQDLLLADSHRGLRFSRE
jgi:hypothetical protein